MPKQKISEFNANPALNTDIDSINIAEGCAPSGINDAIRELMAQLKDFQTGAVGDSFNGPVGTTTAAAGAFTTLSSTGNTTLGDASGDSVTINGTATFANANPTLSAGTANGVAYLNGSKVVTSGSALTFDGTTLSLGTGGSIRLPSGYEVGFGATNTTYWIGDSTNNWHRWFTSSSEQMRLTSTGLGIGTSSPSTKLTVVSDVSGGTDLTSLENINSGANTTKFAGIKFRGRDTVNSGKDSAYIRVYPADQDYVGSTLTFWTRSSDALSSKMTLDPSGHLGLGVTPSAWDADFKAVQIQRAAVSSYNNVIAIFSQNNYADKYIASSLAASKYQQNAGAHSWFTAASGTAGNAITFSQVMTLDASGNLGLGTTSPSSVSNYGAMTINGTNGGLLDVKYGNTLAGRIVGSSGSFGIEVGGTSYFNIYTNGSERARIDSSGNLLVGTTSAGAKLMVDGSASSSSRVANFRSRTTGDTSYSCGLFSKNTNDSTTSQVFIQFSINNDGTTSGQINANGANQAAFGSWSDSRLKENIVNLPSQLSNIMALRPVEFDYIQSEGGGHQVGFIAQEIETIYPDSVGERSDGMKTVTGWSKTEARLVKAIQELKAEFDAYKASHP